MVVSNRSRARSRIWPCSQRPRSSSFRSHGLHVLAPQWARPLGLDMDRHGLSHLTQAVPCSPCGSRSPVR